MWVPQMPDDYIKMFMPPRIIMVYLTNKYKDFLILLKRQRVIRFFLFLLNDDVFWWVLLSQSASFGMLLFLAGKALVHFYNKTQTFESLIYWRSGTWQMPKGISVRLNPLIKISLKWICDLRTGWFISITNYCTDIQGYVFKRSPLYKLISVLSLFWEAESKFFGSYNVVAPFLYLQLSHILW